MKISGEILTQNGMIELMNIRGRSRAQKLLSNIAIKVQKARLHNALIHVLEATGNVK